MRVFQADYRTVRVETAGLSLLLRYCLYQDDEERLPESISCQGNAVVAYFLASTIRDLIGETPQGFYVHRRWKILREGCFALPFCLELPVSAPFLFPGAAADTRPPASPRHVGEDRSAYPNGLYLFSTPAGLAVFSDPEPEAAEKGSVAIWSLQEVGRAGVRLQVRYPDATRAPQRPPRRRRRGPARASTLPCLPSAGSLERAHRLNVVCAPPEQLREQATTAVLERLGAPAGSGQNLDAGALKDLLKREIARCLEQELVQRGGVCGLPARAGAEMVSVPASCGLALLLVRACPQDAQRVETALRLADFTLRAQHPGGAFYEGFDPLSGSWLASDASAASRQEEAPTVSARTTALVASRLAQLAAALGQGRLRSAGLRGARYLQAARCLGDALIAADPPFEQPAERLEVDGLRAAQPGSGSLAFLELYGELAALTGKDAYRKACATLRSRLLAPGAFPVQDRLDQALLRARLALLAVPAPSRRGVCRAPTPPLRELTRTSFSELLPWIYLNGPTALVCGRNRTGALVPSLGADTLLLCGFQTAYLLLCLDRLLGNAGPLPALGQLVTRLLACTAQGPVGSSLPLALDEGDEPEAPPAATRIQELLCLQRLLADFPSLHGKPAAGKGRRAAR